MTLFPVSHRPAALLASHSSSSCCFVHCFSWPHEARSFRRRGRAGGPVRWSVCPVRPVRWISMFPWQSAHPFPVPAVCRSRACISVRRRQLLKHLPICTILKARSPVDHVSPSVDRTLLLVRPLFFFPLSCFQVSLVMFFSFSLLYLCA